MCWRACVCVFSSVFACVNKWPCLSEWAAQTSGRDCITIRHSQNVHAQNSARVALNSSGGCDYGLSASASGVGVSVWVCECVCACVRVRKCVALINSNMLTHARTRRSARFALAVSLRAFIMCARDDWYRELCRECTWASELTRPQIVGAHFAHCCEFNACVRERECEIGCVRAAWRGFASRKSDGQRDQLHLCSALRWSYFPVSAHWFHSVRPASVQLTETRADSSKTVSASRVRQSYCLGGRRCLDIKRGDISHPNQRKSGTSTSQFNRASIGAGWHATRAVRVSVSAA